MPHLPVTSQEAFYKKNNVFVWRTFPDDYKIVLSWRVDKDLPMRHKDLYRWVHEASQEHFTSTGLVYPPYEIFPVEITRSQTFPLTYDGKIAIDPKSGSPSQPIPRGSSELVAAGNYGLFAPDGGQSASPFYFQTKRSIYRYKTDSNVSHILLPQSGVEQGLCNQVKARDGRKCCLTGVEMSENNLDVTYILPPWFAYMALDRDDTVRVESVGSGPEDTPANVAQIAKVLSNCLTMSKEAIPLFEKSIIAIDVDDNYRIVRFYEGKEVNAALKHPLLEYFAPKNTDADRFLRAHFVYSLTVQAYGCDHQDCYPNPSVEKFMRERGLYNEGEEFSLKGKLSLPGWDSYLGRQIIAWFQDERYEDWKPEYLEGYSIGPPPM